jgi:serine/threonine protein kinase
MTALRHPNVVLFMAACTKSPKMFIVMEYMALGSLFDVRTTPLHVCTRVGIGLLTTHENAFTG